MQKIRENKHTQFFKLELCVFLLKGKHEFEMIEYGKIKKNYPKTR